MSFRDTRILFFNDTATTEIYTLSLRDALPISPAAWAPSRRCTAAPTTGPACRCRARPAARRTSSAAASGASPGGVRRPPGSRSEEHTPELQSRQYLVCRLLLEKKKQLILTPL